MGTIHTMLVSLTSGDFIVGFATARDSVECAITLASHEDTRDGLTRAALYSIVRTIGGAIHECSIQEYRTLQASGEIGRLPNLSKCASDAREDKSHHAA